LWVSAEGPAPTERRKAMAANDEFQPRSDTPIDPSNGLPLDYLIGHFHWKCPPGCGVEHTRDMEQNGPGTDERVDTCPFCGRTYRLRATFTVEIKEVNSV
jgi:hypothetical protein